MAASIYATPPPDLSGEDTALSDVSNSSQVSSSSSQQSKVTKRNISATLLGSTNNNNTNNILNNNNSGSSSRAINNTYDPMQLDQSKKRRKQSTPIRLSALNLTPTNLGTTTTTLESATAQVSTTIANNITSSNHDSKNVNDDCVQPLALAATRNSSSSVITKSSEIDSESEKLLSNVFVSPKGLPEFNDNKPITTSTVINSTVSKNAETTTTVTTSIPGLLVASVPTEVTSVTCSPDIASSAGPTTTTESSTEVLPTSTKPTAPIVSGHSEGIGNMPPSLSFTDFHLNISSLARSSFQEISSKLSLRNRNVLEDDEDEETDIPLNPKISESVMEMQRHKICSQCGEKFDSDIKLGMHILQHHSPASNLLHHQQQQYQKQQRNEESVNDNTKEESQDNIVTKIKLEPDSHETNNSNDQTRISNAGLPRPDEWLSVPGLGFPFPPEAAAAALSATNYLSQLPLLSVPTVGSFGSVEGLSRPPLRIFNPEAYCDLCNKEFCNKYFLKTHKANKHGIYEPASSSNDSPASNQMNQLTQVLQMQLQQQQQQQLEQQQAIQFQQHSSPQQQPQQPNSAQQQEQTQQSLTSQEPAVYCDICHKKFTNVFAMKRHRNKTHEVPPPTSPVQIKSESDSNPIGTGMSSSGGSGGGSNNSSEKDFPSAIRLPEGFREDFSIEQEDVSFTPQPRRLSPSSSQQAREANFSVEKLKRLGVINPEAFCDLCCKEYCNKYFLRTHKLKRHGILVPADDAKDEKLQWPFMQTTPLNLMIASEKISRKLSTDSLGEPSTKKFKEEAAERSSPSVLKFNGSNQDEGSCSKEDSGRNNELPHNIHVTNALLEAGNLIQDPEAISIDLQKLQSMILQLNDLGGQRPSCCNICGKELENPYLLHAHIATEHSNISSTIGNAFFGIDNVNSSPMVKTSRCSSPGTSNSTGVTNANNSGSNGGNILPNTNSCQQQPVEVCKQCDKEFPNLLELKQHVIETHGLRLNSPLREGFITPERPVNSGSNPPMTPNQNERRPPYTITPTSSYCEICNKELCNKYFMKTHMQRMHGIEIENGAQIGGVVCNICNKELCSKYFLRVHKHNTHGIVEEGSPIPSHARQNGDPSDNENSTGMFPSVDSSGAKSEMSDVSSRYFTHYTEVCPLCSRRFRSPKWLRAHLMSDHGKAGTDKLREMEQHMNFNKPPSPTLKIPNGGLGVNNIDPSLLTKGAFSGLFMGEDVANSPRFKEYQCSLCSFSTPYYAFLFIHERSHTLLSNAPSSNKSETAVSITTKDQQRVSQQQPSSMLPATNSSSGISGNSVGTNAAISSGGGTPTTTPASTPIPQTPQETANSNGSNLHKHDLSNIPVLTSLSRSTSSSISPSTLPVTVTSSSILSSSILSSSQPSTSLSSSSQMGPTNALSTIIPAFNTLSDLANIVNRPASYAIPQSYEGEIMQSFLIEETRSNNSDFSADNSTTVHPMSEMDNRHEGSKVLDALTSPVTRGVTATAATKAAEGASPKMTSDIKAEGNRFVPAIIFLPVRERISGPITVSFTLTPA